jgi:hypothetical protein
MNDMKDTKMTTLFYRKKKPATHPQTGDTISYTDVIVYLYPNKWRSTEYGVDTGYQSYKNGMSRTQAIKAAKRTLIDDGFYLVEQKTKETDYTAFDIIDAVMIQP